MKMEDCSMKSELAWQCPGRTFQLWEYQVTHGSLLIRSPATGEETTNVDLVFTGVEYVAVPGFMDGLSLDRATDEEVGGLKDLLGNRWRDAKVFILVSQHRRFPIVGASLRIEQNEWEIFDSPFEFGNSRAGSRELMNIEAVKLDLAGRGGDLNALYTGEGNPEDRYAILQEREKWVVFYSERGQRHAERAYVTEDGACRYLRGLLAADNTVWRSASR